jgi:hypothetical protein
MKTSSVCFALLSFILAAGTASAQEPFQPTPQQAASISYICKGWRPIARDIYTLKTSGKPRPKSNSPLHAKIVEDIYYEKSSITSVSMAEEVGEQLCVPFIREKFRTGEMRLRN